VEFQSLSEHVIEYVDLPFVIGLNLTSEKAESGRAAIVNETAARMFWPGEDPIGKRLTQVGEQDVAEVVGVVKDTEIVRPGVKNLPVVYLGTTANTAVRTVLLARTRMGYRGLASAIPGALHQLDPDLLIRVDRLEDNLQAFITPSAIAATFAGALGGLGLALATIGI